MCALPLGDETLQWKSQYPINVSALTSLFVLHGTNLLRSSRFRETQAANGLADVIASWTDSRRWLQLAVLYRLWIIYAVLNLNMRTGRFHLGMAGKSGWPLFVIGLVILAAFSGFWIWKIWKRRRSR